MLTTTMIDGHNGDGDDDDDWFCVRWVKMIARCLLCCVD